MLFRRGFIKNSLMVSLLLFVSILMTSCFSSSKEQVSLLPENLSKIVLSNYDSIRYSKQIIIVNSETKKSSYVKVNLLEKKDDRWKVIVSNIKATIGKNGFAKLNSKKGGDGKTPSGLFDLGSAFGYEKIFPTKLQYRQATENDFWVEDVKSRDYNSWVNGTPKTSLFQKMKRNDNLYKLGVVVKYNTIPIVKGDGGPVFFHIWEKPGKKTVGSIAMAEKDIVKMVKLLDISKTPIAIMGNNSTLPKDNKRIGSKY